MKHLAIVGVALLGAACGGKNSGSSFGSRGGAPRGPVIVFVGLGQSMMFEGACHAPAGGPDCATLHTAALDGTKQVTSGGATFRITGTVSDECEASGASDVVGLERVSGAEDAYPGVVTYPADAVIDLESYSIATDEGGEHPAATVADDVRAALARVATTDVKGQENAREIKAAEIVVEQVVTTNVDADPKADVLIAAHVPLPDDDGSGYQWSALVLLPGGDPGAAVSLWTSDLEHLWLDASFDLEGDGRRELVYSAQYYEGGGHGVAAIKDGKLEMLGQWGCGA